MIKISVNKIFIKVKFGDDECCAIKIKNWHCLLDLNKWNLIKEFFETHDRPYQLTQLYDSIADYGEICLTPEDIDEIGKMMGWLPDDSIVIFEVENNEL